ncbi:hypothetical protein V9N51_000031 [Vibrio cholerae]
MKNKQIPIKFILWGLISMYGTPTFSMTLFQPDEMSYSVSVTFGELVAHREKEVSANMHGKLINLVVGSTYNNGTYVISYAPECLNPNPRPFDHYTNENPNYYDAMNEIITTLGTCRWELSPAVGEDLDYVDIIYATSSLDPDRPSEFKNLWFRFMGDDGEIGNPPTQCQSSLTDEMRFGIVSGPGPYKSETNMYVKCSQKTAFDVKVNNSREFIDPESGTRITFEDFSTGSFALDCTNGCTVPLAGEMTVAPTRPGKYQWAVPVIVEYK